MTTIVWIFITLQIVMGGSDTLYHHEFSEKLAWRKSQTHELWLHGIRNIFYAVIFFGLGTIEPGGLWAYVIIIGLGVEFLITLWDFVEEDLTRKLPASERLLHTVLTANYGVVLSLLVPVLWNWGHNDTALTWTWYGPWSVLMIIAALGVFVLGLRDFHASRRLKQLWTRPAADLITKMDGQKTVLITGGTGFIGRRLIPALQADGHKIIVLTRNATTADLPAPITLIEKLADIQNDASIDVIINLAGESLSNGLWTAKKQIAMRESRIGLTSKLIELIARLESKPELLLNGSAIGVYGVTPDGELREDNEITSDGTVSQKLCRDWEAEARKAEAYKVRVVLLRIGMVLDREGGALNQIIIPTEFGGGAVFGNGNHMMSWITRDDLVGLIGHIIATPAITGAINGVGPEPVNNKRFTKAVASALYRPTLVSIPAFVIKALGGLGREILLGDQTVVPAKALAHGYVFKDPNVEIAMQTNLRGSTQ